MFGGWFAKCLASARGDVKHTWVVKLSGMVARVYDQSVDGVVLSEAHLAPTLLDRCETAYRNCSIII